MFVYMDNAATKVNSLNMQHLGNPSSAHLYGRNTREIVEQCRRRIGFNIGITEGNLVFTSGGTESNNLAIFGVAKANKDKTHFITSKIEHDSVLACFEELEKEGCSVTYLDVDKNGFVNPEDVRAAITDDTLLVSIMYANNEIGTIQNIEIIGEICTENDVYFHTDAVQAFGNIYIDVDMLNIDLMSMSAHKLCAGCTGLGMLYVRDTVKIKPMIVGGGQEYGLRSGTENFNTIILFDSKFKMLHSYENKIPYLIKKLNEHSDEIRFTINGGMENKLPNILSVTFDGVNHDTLATLLGNKNFYVSTGSACNAFSFKNSHVLEAIGQHGGAIRISFTDGVSYEEIDSFVMTLVILLKDIQK